MEFEWDEAKRRQTLQERGLDFADIAELEWDQAITLEDLRYEYGEPRFVTFGHIAGRLCVVAWCWRNENKRIISLRKANAREVRRFDKD